jgi:apolipoprotein N-acyltransferase
MDTPVGKVGTLICFEDTNGNLTRRFVKGGARLLVNLTNDGWFLRTAGPETHLANAVFRAVENRTPLLRCTNTGVSCLVDPHGRVDRRIEAHRQGFAVHPVPVRNAPATFYARHGDWIVWLVSGVSLSAAIRRRHALRAAASP